MACMRRAAAGAVDVATTSDLVATAIRLYEAELARGPVACSVLGGRARGVGIGPHPQARAREHLGVEVVRGPDGVPNYRLPLT